LIPVFGIGRNKSAVRKQRKVRSEKPPYGCQSADKSASCWFSVESVQERADQARSLFPENRKLKLKN
jgi:hypothetical protein